MVKAFLKENLPMILGPIITAAGVTITGILFHQAFIRILPLYVSMIIALLQSRMNRYASLLGGINSLLYAMVSFYYLLYAQAVYCILVSCPIQIVTFIRWSKKPWGVSTVFRKLSGKARLLVAAALAVSEAVLIYVLLRTGGNYIILDSTITLIGVLVSILTMLSYLEYVPLMVINGILTVVLYVIMMLDVPEQSTYVVFSVYSLISSVIAFFRIQKLYKVQQSRMNGE